MDMAAAQIPECVGECLKQFPKLAYDDDDDDDVDVAVYIFTFCFFEVYSDRFST